MMSMDYEALERLLADRASGTIPADVESLLDAYLACDDGAAELWREVDSTVTLARKAMNPCDAHLDIPLPPLATERPTRAGRRRHLGILRKAAPLAAGLVLGVAVGAGLLRKAPQPVRPGPPAIARSDAPRLTPSARSTGKPGFWSTRRLWEQATRPRATRPPVVVWDSPVKMPRIGDDRL